MIRLDVDAFTEFCAALRIPSKDYGLVALTLWGTQRHWVNSLAAGLERGVHSFIILKGGRQIGGTTVADALTLWWLQENASTQGMLVCDEDDNRDYRRDLLLGMNEALPKGYRLPLIVNNRVLMTWPNGSRLSLRSAGKRMGSQLGRSRGISFLHADEVGAWPDQNAIMSLRAALSERNPLRLYMWNSTAQGIGTPFHDMWKVAGHSVATHAVFIAWWQREDYILDGEEDARWVYAVPERTTDEKHWIEAVRDRYDHAITEAQLGWYRWKLAEEFSGDETMMAQEFACLPEEAFQAFGDKFISPRLIRKLRLNLPMAPRPSALAYEFLDSLDETAEHGLRECDPATAGCLRIWEEPQPDGIYVVAGHPRGASSEWASQFVCQVYRVWPDQMVQVAEYSADKGLMYQFAWVCLHLAGAYRTDKIPAYFILEVAGPGRAALEQIQLLERYGFGLSDRARRGPLHDFLSCVRHYFYSRPDSPFRKPSAQEWHTQGATRSWMLHGLRDAVERRQLEIRSPELIDNLAMLREGEAGDKDVIAAGAGQSDALAMCAAMAVKCWTQTAVPELQEIIAPRTLSRDDPATVEQYIVQRYVGDILRGGR